jgi:hypothetical protein
MIVKVLLITRAHHAVFMLVFYGQPLSITNFDKNSKIKGGITPKM